MPIGFRRSFPNRRTKVGPAIAFHAWEFGSVGGSNQVLEAVRHSGCTKLALGRLWSEGILAALAATLDGLDLGCLVRFCRILLALLRRRQIDFFKKPVLSGIATSIPQSVCIMMNNCRRSAWIFAVRRQTSWKDLADN
jgi:hypothetical protein